MTKIFAAASFALAAVLSGLSAAHAAGFNDRSPAIDAIPAHVAPQNLSRILAVHGFNDRSDDASTRQAAPAPGRTVATSTRCDLSPRAGFQDSTSFASC